MNDEPSALSGSSTVPTGSTSAAPAPTDTVLRRVVAVLEAARPVPLSTSVMVNREELLELIDTALTRLPEELRAARWLLKEREEYLATAQRDGDEILTLARSQAERMVERNEIVKAAEMRARRVVDDAEAEGRRIRRQVEDMCDSRLAELEGIVERIRTEIIEGRIAMAGPRRRKKPPTPEPEPAPAGPFDQDAE